MLKLISLSRYFAAYATAILVFFLITHNKVRLIRWLYWGYDQTPFLHQWQWTRRRSDQLISTLSRLKRQPVCVLAKTDEVWLFIPTFGARLISNAIGWQIHDLFRMVTYVHKNEETSCLKLVHFYRFVDEIPSELEANAKRKTDVFLINISY